jgi:MFS family permease
MEERKLTEKESLELISQMIRNTQTKMEENSGVMFLIWGYLSVFTTLLVWSLLMTSFNYQWQWFWFLLPVGGSILTLLHYKKESRKPRANTYIDRMIGYIWRVLGIVGFALSMISIFTYKFPILFIIVLIMGIGTTLTGMVIRFKPLIYSGTFGMIVSVVFLFVEWKIQMPVFAAVFLFMMVIPGHILNHIARKRNK